jgi:hypothetical protein
MTQRNVLPIASVPCGEYKRPIELPHLETFPGAACSQPIELPGYPATAGRLPSRRSVSSARGLFATGVIERKGK